MAGRLSMATERLASSMKPLPTSSFGYPVREPVPSEQAFFALNPNVGGYAAEDGAIVLNEGAKYKDRYLSNRELGSVAQNEASRLYMRDRAIVPDFSLTKDQELEFQGTAYGSNPEALKQSIAARIITGDQSAGDTTPEQKSFAQGLLKQMQANGEPVATNPEPKRGIVAKAASKLEEVLGVPRPWELGLVTSVGYQLAAGEGPLVERARKGGAQFLGRYATNMANPALAFQFPTLGEDYEVSDILQDSASWMRPEYYVDKRTIPIDAMVRGNEVLSRDLFELPSRIPVEETDLVKTGPKQYTVKEGSPLKPEANEAGLYYNYLLGKYNVTQNPETKALQYNDTWDLSSPLGPAKVKVFNGDEDYAPDYAQENSPLSYMARKLVNPYLRPATVSGSIPADKKGKPKSK
jgi:hypothetical protein